MNIEHSETDREIIFRASGRIDATNALDFEKGILPFLEGSKKKAVLDFSGIEYISSSGLRVLMNAAKILKVRNEKLTIRGVSADVFPILSMSGFGTIINISQAK